MAEGFITRRGGGVDVSDATATENDVLQGETFYSGNKDIKTGNIPSKSAETFTPGTTNQTIASGQYLSGTQTILGDADLLPENIKDGVTIFGVEGTIPVFTPTVATGGTVTDVNIGGTDYRIHAFTSVGTSTFTVTEPGTNSIFDYFIVAGGGAGGSAWNAKSSPGHGGEVITQTNVTMQQTSYLITVGNGGLGLNYPNPAPAGDQSGVTGGSINVTAQGGQGGESVRFSGSAIRVDGQTGYVGNDLGVTSTFSGQQKTYSVLGESDVPLNVSSPASPIPNSGNGGVARWDSFNEPGGNGGSGIVLIRYPLEEVS